MAIGTKGGRLGRKPKPEDRLSERLVVPIHPDALVQFKAVLKEGEKPAVVARRLIEAEISKRQGALTAAVPPTLDDASFKGSKVDQAIPEPEDEYDFNHPRPGQRLKKR